MALKQIKQYAQIGGQTTTTTTLRAGDSMRFLPCALSAYMYKKEHAQITNPAKPSVDRT